MRHSLTAQFVKNVKPRETRAEYWDRGLCLRVSDTSTAEVSKSWTVMYRRGKKQIRMTLGTFPTLSLNDARLAAQRVLRAAQLGDDPASDKRAAREALTFGDISKHYLENYAKVHKRESSAYADERMIESDLKPWDNLPAKEIKKEQVAKLIDAIVKRGSPIKANRTLALISKIFNFAIGRGAVEVNPTRQFPRPGKESSRKRVLTDDEIRQLRRTLDTQPAKVAAFFWLALLTGQRAREILCMAKAEVDFELATWTIPGARTKNKRDHLVPLGPQAMNLLESLKGDHPYIFPARTIEPRPLTEYKKWVEDIRTATGMTKSKGHPEHFDFHDLRRTMTTGMTRMGVTQFLTDKITNHTDRTIGAVYNRYEYEAEKRDALTKWDARLAEIVR